MSEFYQRLRTSPQSPSTSTPSPSEFLAAYEHLLKEAETVVSIHMMGTKTTIPTVARMAADMAPVGRVRVIDSRSVSLGLGLLVMEAARAAQAGESADSVQGHVESLIPNTHLHAAVREMTQLRKSGRVSLGQALLANALSIKPLVYAAASAIEVVEKTRGFHHAVEEMIARAREKAGPHQVDLAVIHSDCEGEAEELLARLKGEFNCRHTLVADVGANLAAHVGIGALGIGTMRTTG